MAEQRGNKVNLKEGQTQIANQRRTEELELMVQRLQHRLRIYEGLEVVNDDVKVVEENDDQDEEFDGNYIPLPRGVERYPRGDYHREHQWADL